MCRPDRYQLCGCRRYGTGVTVIVVEEEYHWAILWQGVLSLSQTFGYFFLQQQGKQEETFAQTPLLCCLCTLQDPGSAEAISSSCSMLKERNLRQARAAKVEHLCSFLLAGHVSGATSWKNFFLPFFACNHPLFFCSNQLLPGGPFGFPITSLFLITSEGPIKTSRNFTPVFALHTL